MAGPRRRGRRPAPSNPPPAGRPSPRGCYKFPKFWQTLAKKLPCGLKMFQRIWPIFGCKGSDLCDLFFGRRRLKKHSEKSKDAVLFSNCRLLVCNYCPKKTNVDEFFRKSEKQKMEMKKENTSKYFAGFSQLGPGEMYADPGGIRQGPRGLHFRGRRPIPRFPYR